MLLVREGHKSSNIKGKLKAGGENGTRNPLFGRLYLTDFRTI